MIQPGTYNLICLSQGSETSFGAVEVLAVEGHLIKVKFPTKEQFTYMNTAASTFISLTHVEAKNASMRRALLELPEEAES